jgi:hypothetical protein
MSKDECLESHWVMKDRRLYNLNFNIFLPSDIEQTLRETESEKVATWFFMDTSGSCWGLAPRFFHAAKSLDPEKFDVKYFAFDTMVYEVDVKKQKLDHQNVVDNQMRRYKIEGFPDNLGLFDSGFTIRSNNQQVKKFNETWWKEVLENSARDQLSQVYSSWKTNIPINSIKIDRSIYHNRYLEPKKPHPKKWTV